MSEYYNVEKPFLDKLESLGWIVIDHGAKGIPQNPKTSLRASFNEIVLIDTFKQSVKQLNLSEDGQTWLTDKQLEDIYQSLISPETTTLHEANKAIFNSLRKNINVERNELTSEESPIVKLIDFDNWQNNRFIAINQFRIDTPHGTRHSIIPDIVLFVNGLPLVVIECKDEDVNEPMSEAFEQIRRYSNCRDDDFGAAEGEEKLFYFNLFNILTHGKEARFGTISAEFDYYYNWKDIFPEYYKSIPITQDNEQTQEVMILGLLNREILLDVFKHFTLFMEIKSGVEIKTVCRYQQYRAVGKIIERLRNPNNTQRSGVVWHTQGSGKSLTMVFLVRKLRSQDDLKDYKVILVNDRTDLEEQLGETAQLTDESVNIVESRKQLRPMLSDDFGNLNMVMVHKCLEEDSKHSKAIAKALMVAEQVPEYKMFEVVNPSEKVLLLIDEAHRTQGGEMGDNLFSAFPNAAKIAFTGTPLLTKRHKVKTHERFGSFIDEYKIKQSVRDKATLDIVYIGKTSKDKIKDSNAFKQAFEDAFKKQTQEERLEIQKRYGTMQAYLENKDRLRAIAEDIIEHYLSEIHVNGFKAQVVASSIIAAARYEYLLKEALQKKIDTEKQLATPDMEKIKAWKFLEVCTVVTQQDNNEDGYISAARAKAKRLKAVDSFKMDFDFDKPESGVAILCVCDKLLTGFDAPVEQVMYLDKNLREHDLLQAIARVNRTKGKEKTHGLVVDYFGVANHLKEALAIYSNEDEAALKEFLEYFRDINSEIPVLEARYHRLLQLFSDKGISQIEAFVNQQVTDKQQEFLIAENCIELAEDLGFRAQFETYAQAFFDSLDLLFNTDESKRLYIPAKRFGYLLARIKSRYRDPTMDLSWASRKVRKLIDEYLLSEGIDSKVPEISLLSDEFPKTVDKLLNAKARASEMEHAIRRHIKVEFDQDPELYTQFNERLQELLQRFKGHWDALEEEMQKMREEMKQGRPYDDDMGLSPLEQAFCGVIIQTVFKEQTLEANDKEMLKNLTLEALTLISTDESFNKNLKFWDNLSMVRTLRGKLEELFMFSELDAIAELNEKLATEILALAKIRSAELKKTNV